METTTHYFNPPLPDPAVDDSTVMVIWSDCGQMPLDVTVGLIRATHGQNPATPSDVRPCPACVHVMTGFISGPTDCTCGDRRIVSDDGWLIHCSSIDTIEHDAVVALIEMETCPAEKRALTRLLIARDGTAARRA